MVSTVRRTRSKSSPQKPPNGKKTSGSQRKRKGVESDAAAAEDDHETPEPMSPEDHDDSDAYEEPGSDAEHGVHDEDAVSLDSDALDDDFDAPSSKKRKRTSPTKKPSPKKKTSPKKRKVDDDDSDENREDGLEVVGTVVQAPKTGRVPPGRISQNTFSFLKQLQNPEFNDRQWFKLHDPVFRQAEKEFKDFVDEFTPLLTKADTQIPPLPPKDVIHRIYRDVRFSNDKTPYKTGFSASFSRSGRKGIFAGYHIAVKPGGSMIAAGTWCPGKNELQTIRNNITHSSTRLREVISEPEFTRLFGDPKPHPKGGRRNIFGMEDELKVAPKGIDKTHKDIDLLKCRSFAVVHKFTDKQALASDFREELARVVKVVQPFVHCLNDMMTVQPAEASEQSDDAEDS